MSKLIRAVVSLWERAKKTPLAPIVFVVVFAVIGTFWLSASRAATPSVALEPENGVLGGGASAAADTSASGSKYLQLPASSLTTVPVPASIAADCSHDVTTQLNDWISSLPSNTLAQLKKDGCYATEDVVAITDKSHLLLDGNNATFRRTLREGNQPRGNHLHVRIDSADNIEVRNLTIIGEKDDTEGYNAGLEAQHGFGLYGVLHGTFDNVKISSIHGDCFYFNTGANRMSQYITIQNSSCHQTGRHGVAVLAGSDILIRNNTIEYNHRENFDFEPYGTGRGGANNITIDSNTIGPGTQLLISAADGSPEVKNLAFTNNVVHRRFAIQLGSAGQGLRRGPLVISNNTSDVPSHGNAIIVDGFDDIDIENNHILFDGTTKGGDPNSYLLNAIASRHVRLTQNVADGAKGIAQFDASSSDFCVLSNTPPSLELPVCR